MSVALFAYLIDRLFGEFAFLKHPVALMGDYIAFFERRWYRDTILRGALLCGSLLLICYAIAAVITHLVTHPLLLGAIASTGLASKMLYDSVRGVIDRPHTIRYLVSRDTGALTPSQINQAAVETYAENLSDGVIAPLFYLLLFGLEGLFLYKAVNTMDSMIGYRTPRYDRFGKCAARLDDLSNYLPARITALLIILLFASRRALGGWRQGAKHQSLNAGYPINAMARALGVRLGGPVPYFGKLKAKPVFAADGEEASSAHIRAALRLQPRLDLLLLSLLLYSSFVGSA